MKYRCLLLFMISIFGFSTLSAQETSDTLVFDLKNDSTEYQLIIIDIGFDSWLATQKPISFYTNEYCRAWNIRYVSEWNYLYNTGRYPDYVESYVDYRPEIDYGIELNYKLYSYFQFFEEKYKITLVQRR